jgi:hypothetical protein
MISMATVTDPDKEGYVPYPKPEPVGVPNPEREPVRRPQPLPTPA